MGKHTAATIALLSLSLSLALRSRGTVIVAAAGNDGQTDRIDTRAALTALQMN